jgi:hypothetical protein
MFVGTSAMVQANYKGWIRELPPSNKNASKGAGGYGNERQCYLRHNMPWRPLFVKEKGEVSRGREIWRNRLGGRGALETGAECGGTAHFPLGLVRI